jgi:adenosine kinase
VTLGIVAPDGRDGMLQHAREFRDAGIPFIFDPGQGLPMFNGEELTSFIDLADYVTVNDYEAALLQERTGKSPEQLAKQVKALIVTLGAKGSVIYAGGKKYDIPCVKPEAVLDPTGCGDAFRAGLLYGITHGMDWAVSGRLASLIGALKIAQRGPQNHRFTRASIAALYHSNFGTAPW